MEGLIKTNTIVLCVCLCVCVRARCFGDRGRWEGRRVGDRNMKNSRLWLETITHACTHTHTHECTHWCCFEFRLFPCVVELEWNLVVLKISQCRIRFITTCTIPTHTQAPIRTGTHAPPPHTHARAHTPLPHPLISLLTDLLPFHVKYLGCVWQVWRKLPWRNDFIYLTSTSSEVSVSSWERDDPKFQWEETGANPKKLECWGSCFTCYFNAGNHSW